MPMGEGGISRIIIYSIVNLTFLIGANPKEIWAETPAIHLENDFIRVEGRVVTENPTIKFGSPIVTIARHQEPNSAEIASGKTKAGIRRTLVGDLDCDGVSEIILLQSNFTISSLTLCVNGDCGEAEITKLPKDTELNTVVVGNFDREGCANDLIFSNDKGEIKGLFGRANMQYESPINVRNLGYRINSITAADLDGDNIDDLAYSSTEKGVTSILQGALSHGADSFGKVATVVLDAPSQILRRVPNRATTPTILIYSSSAYREWRELSWHSQNQAISVVVPISNPSSQRWGPPLGGDFNGDGYGDILIQGSRAIGWWAFYGSQFGYIGRSLLAPIPTTAVVRWIEVIDLNQDGSDDIVWSNDEEIEKITYSLSTPAKPLPDVRIQLGNDNYVTTDREGKFFAKVKRDDRIKIKPYRSGYVFAPIESAPIVSDTDRIVAAFIGQTRELLERERGRPVRVGVDAPGPYICNGFLPHGDELWGRTKVCPSGYAAVSIDDGFGKGAEKGLPSWTLLSCCRLPSADILTGRTIKAEMSCPNNYVVIGTDESEILPNKSYPLICAEINTNRYFLGKETNGVYWGSGQSLRGEKTFLPSNQIPISAFYGVASAKFRDLEDDGCLGDPVGSLMVGRGVGDCTKHAFRSLLYRGQQGDPAKGAPVQIFPKCSTMENPYDPTSGCTE